jgi:hypothetical protein
MTQLRNTELGSQKFLNLREGMSVYDAKGDKVGTIRQLYFGASGELANEEGEGSATAPNVATGLQDNLVADIARAFVDEDKLPEPVRDRLLHDGFLRIDATGIFTSDRFVTPDQVSSISGDKVNLNVLKDALIKS